MEWRFTCIVVLVFSWAGRGDGTVLFLASLFFCSLVLVCLGGGDGTVSFLHRCSCVLVLRIQW